MINHISKYYRNTFVFVLFVFLTTIINAQTTLVLNGGITVLNGGTAGTPVYLVVNESNTAGITRLSGHIHSENQYNFIKWIVGTGTGNYIFPFGVAGNSSDYIPFTFNKTTVGNSNIDMSTWQTNVQNMPHAAITNVGAVTSMTGSADSVTSALDRFWDIQTSSATTADLTFSYLGIENTTSNPTDTVKAQHWNGSSWDTQVGPGNLGVIAGVGTAGPFVGQSTFSPWILSIFSPCPAPIISYPSSYCDNDTTPQSVTLTGGSGGVYSVSPSGLTIDTLTGTIIPSTSLSGTYTVTYTIDSTATCPILITNTTVTINPTVISNQTATICEGGSVLLGGSLQTTAGIYNDTLSSILGCDSVVITTLSVNPIDTTQTTDSICQGQSILLGGALQTTAGIYYDTLTSSLTCDSIIVTTLSINALPTIVASIDDTICPGISSNISASGGSSYSWDNGLGLGQNHTVIPSTTTTYIVTGTDVNGCQNTDTVNVVVNPGTIANAGANQEFCDDILTFTLNANTPLLAGEIGTWSTFSGIGVISDTTNPTSSGTGLTIGSSIFVWTITNSSCPPSSDTVTITVIECIPSALIIPNVFTPNGDGSNDFFTVKGVSLATVEGQIFNRWGQKMFSWNAINGSWDGRTPSGSLVPDGTYFYIIKALGQDGTEYFKKGAFSLIR